MSYDDQVPKTKLIRIPPFSYLHILDRNTNVTRLVEGPQTFVCKEHERVVFGPEKMLIVPPRHYCLIANPVVRKPPSEEELEKRKKEKAQKKKEEKKEGDLEEKEEQDDRGVVVFDASGQAKLKHGDKEILFERNIPFALYPGEQLIGGMTPLKVVDPNSALRLKASRDFVDKFAPKGPTRRKAGDEWLFEGPATYFPQVEVDIVNTIQAVIIKPNQALKLKAERALVDKEGKARKAGERWLVRMEGAYLPQINETVEGTQAAFVLTEKKALHLKATKTFKDIYGVQRKAGEEWLVTHKEKEAHIPDVYEKVVGEVPLTSLTHREWCIINNPVDENGVPQLGFRKLVVGEANFFLQPGESIEPSIGIRSIYVLGEEEALLVHCQEAFEDKIGNKKIKRVPGQTWFVYGPTEFIPPLQATVIEKRRAKLQIESLKMYLFFWERVML